MPDEQFVDGRGFRRHHAVDPVRVEEGLVYDRGFVIELAVHGEIVAALEGDRSRRADFFCANGNRDADLAGHGGAADNWLVELQNLDDFSDAADITVFGVGMVAGHVILTRETAAVGGEVEGYHSAFLYHSLVVHDAVVLATVTASSV